MKKIAALIFAALFVLLAVPAAADDVAGTGSETAAPLTGETINVYNWGMYIADGLTDEFTRRTGIKVNYSTYEDNESLYTKLKTGGSSYDIIIPSDYMVAKLIEEDMLLPLDFANIPNFEYVDAGFRGKDFDPDNKFSVPYTWGSVGIIYNSKYVSDVTSWDALWNEDYKGKVLMFGNSRDAFGVGALLLGYDINTTDHDEINAIADKLREQHPLVQQYVMDQSYQQMINGEAWLVPYYAGDYLQMVVDNPDLRFCFPSEGYNLFIDAICIPSCAQNKSGAEAFINFLCDPEINAWNMEEIGYSTTMSAAKEYMDPETANNEFAYPSEEVLSRGYAFVNLPTDTVREVNSLFTSIKSDGGGLQWYIYVIVAVVVVALGVFFALRRKKRNAY